MLAGGASPCPEYVDKGSGRDTDRPEYQRLMKGARRREFDLVLVCYRKP